jgi:hypothetical protein
VRNFFATHRTATRSLLLVVALVTIAAVLVGVVVALGVTGQRSSRDAAPTVTVTGEREALPSALAFGSPALMPARSAGSPTEPGSTTPDVAAPAATNLLPHTSNPETFALAYARALFSYDTRSQTESAWTAALTAGLDTTADVHLDNLADLADRTPPAPVWFTMTNSTQYASFTATRSWVPQLWTRNAAAYPAGASAITVSGTQHVVWAGGSSDVPSSVTLLLVCPQLTSSCVVNRIPAQVLP